MHHGPVFTIVLAIMMILVSGAILKKVSTRLKFPYTISLLLLGLGTGLAIKWFGGDHGLFGLFRMPHDAHVVSPETIIFIFLPALIFESAFSLDSHVFKKNLGATVTFAGPALLVTTFLTAGFMVILTASSWHWGWATALVFGSLISATDPVAVVAILKELGVSKRLGTLIEGESLLNDGTAIVLFTVLFSVIQHGTGGLVASDVILKFLWVVAGGLATGFILSWIFSSWIGRTFNDPLIEISLTLVLGYLCMLLAEGMLQVSGVMALVVAGLYMGSVGRTRISPEVFHFLHHFWELTAYLANTLIFFLVGLVIAQSIESASLRDLILICGAYSGIMAIRFAVTFSFKPVINQVNDEISLADTTLISWGGLRGAVSLALALIVSQEPSLDAGMRNEILLVTVGVVFLTIMVNGTTMKNLLSFFGYDKTPLPKKLANLTAQTHTLEKLKDKVNEFSKSPQFRTISWTEVQEEVTKKTETLHNSLNTIKDNLKISEPAVREAGFWIQALNVERKAYWHALAQGTLGPRSALILSSRIDHHLDLVAADDTTPPESRHSEVSKIHNWAGNFAKKINFLNKHLSAIQFDYLSLQYDLARGESSAASTVIESVNLFKGIDSDIREKIIETYRRYRSQSKERLEEMRINLPEVTRAIEAKLARRITLNVERDLYSHMIHWGEIDEALAKSAIEDIEERMNALLHGRKKMPLLEIKDLIKEVPMFASFGDTEQQNLADRAVEIVVPRDGYLFRENDRGDSLFIIVRGAIKVIKTINGKAATLGVLGGGDIIGEMALLKGEPRFASARAATNVTLIKISKISVDEIIKTDQNLEEAIWRTYSTRLCENFITGKERFSHLDNSKLEAWMNAATQVKLKPGAGQSIPEEIYYAFIVTGIVDFGEGKIVAPRLIEVMKKESFSVKADARIVWLTEPEK